MTGAGQTAFFTHGKRLMIWLLAAICYFSSLKVFLGMEKSSSVSMFLSSVYPDYGQAEDIEETEAKAEKPVDLCFYWDGGIQKLAQKDYGRQTQALIVGLYGDASLYDWRAGGFSRDDTEGCIIDKKTALELFKSEEAEGEHICLGDKIYQVRKVVDWKNRLMLIRPAGKDVRYRMLFARFAKGTVTQTGAAQLLSAHGLSGTVVEDGGLETMVLLALSLLPAAAAVLLFSRAWKERKRCRESLTGKETQAGGKVSREKQGEYWIWTGACALLIVFAVLYLWNNLRIPKEWIPGKWSDFQFWPEKIKTEWEKMTWYLMMPKTALQTGRILDACKAIVLSAAALFLSAAGLFYSVCVDRKRNQDL